MRLPAVPKLGRAPASHMTQADVMVTDPGGISPRGPGGHIAEARRYAPPARYHNVRLLHMADLNTPVTPAEGNGRQNRMENSPYHWLPRAEYRLGGV